MRQQALRHEGTKASRAFSLVEVLMAIVILGIGIISIAALFPAGIAQQRLSGDDFMGPTVANHAISIIRSKVSAEDFGTFEEFLPSASALDWPDTIYTRTIRGDWAWMRPGFLFPVITDPNFPGARGAIDIFSNIFTVDPIGFDPVTEQNMSAGWPSAAAASDRLYGIPYNTKRYELGQPPRRIITQTERYYPMRSQLIVEDVDPARPQYVWDCMFRRYNGRILVAIFVYRVSVPGGGAAQSFIVQPNPNDATIPPLPMIYDPLGPNVPTGGPGVWDILYDTSIERPLAEVVGFAPAQFDLLADNQTWQSPRQWILDQNNNIHRVVSYRREDTERRIELTRPLAPVRLAMRADPNATEAQKYEHPNLDTSGENWPTYSPHEYLGDPSGGPADTTWNPNLTGNPLTRFPLFDRGVVTRFWYIPMRMAISADEEYTLTPVYITVKEL